MLRSANKHTSLCARRRQDASPQASFRKLRFVPVNWQTSPLCSPAPVTAREGPRGRGDALREGKTVVWTWMLDFKCFGRSQFYLKNETVCENGIQIKCFQERKGVNKPNLDPLSKATSRCFRFSSSFRASHKRGRKLSKELEPLLPLRQR